MKFTSDIEINLPRSRVIELMNNPDNMVHWHEGFQSYEYLEGEPGAVGTKMTSHYITKNIEYAITSTIIANNLPKSIEARCEAKEYKCITKSTFSILSDRRTLWRLDNEMFCDGFMMKVMAKLMPSIFKKYYYKHMQNFKMFAERNGKKNEALASP